MVEINTFTISIHKRLSKQINIIKKLVNGIELMKGSENNE